MKKFLLTFFTLTIILNAQIYNFRYYNSSNGLITTSIKCINQDEKGYIWIGTTSGLFRYDGYQIEDVSSLDNNLKTEITGIEYLKNQIWVSTTTRGIFTIDKNNTINHLNDRLVNLPDKIKTLKKGTNKLILITNNNDFYIAQSDSQISKTLVDANLPQTNFNDIIEIDNGYAIASDDGLIIFQYNRIKYRFSQNPQGKPIQVKSLALDRDKNIIFTTSTGSIYKIENYTLSEIYSSNITSANFSMIVDKSNNIWLGCDSGILRIENKKETFISFANGLPHQVVTNLFEDREGNIWIGTLNGIAKLNSLAIKNYPSLFPKVTSAIAKILKGRKELSVFTSEGISYYNFTTESFNNISFRFPGNHINDAIELNDNSILVATNNGLYINHNNKIGVSPLNIFLKSRNILSLAQDSENKIYVGTDSGLFVFEKNKLIDYKSIDDELPGNQVNSVLITKAGDIFIGTDNGLVKLSDNSILVLRKENGLLNNFITSLSEDDEGRVWIGTKAGLSSFKNGRFNNYIPKIYGYNIDLINDVLPVRKNEIWLGTTKGIVIIKNGVEYSYLSSRDGILSDFITDIEYDSKNNLVFIGTNSGLTIIDLKYLRNNTFTYNIHFTALKSKNKNYDLNQLVLSEDDEEIKIYVSIFSFYDERKIVFRYRLKGYEDSWNYLTNSNEIKYKNLPPGKYNLIVEASVDGINWLKDPAELRFEIRSTLIKKILTYATIPLILLLIYYLAFVMVKTLRKKRAISLSKRSFDKSKTSNETERTNVSDVLKLYTSEEVEEIRNRYEEKIESLSKIILENNSLIDRLKDEIKNLQEKINELESELASQSELTAEEAEFVEKSKIEIIVKNHKEVEEIKKYIEALEKTNWSIRAAAKLLNIPHSTLHYRLKKLNLLKNK